MSCCLSVLYYILLSAHSVVANSLNLIFSEKALLLLLSVLGTQMAKVKGWGKLKSVWLKWIFQIVFGTYYWIRFTLFQFLSFYCFTSSFVWLMMKQVFSHLVIILLLKNEIHIIIKIFYSLGFFTNAKHQQQNMA